MRTIRFVLAAVRYTATYLLWVYVGMHIGTQAADSRMNWLSRYAYGKFRTAPKVVVYSCMDARLVAFGQLFLHTILTRVVRSQFGVTPVFYNAAGAGPSVAAEDHPHLAAAHRTTIIEGAQVAHAACVVVTAHAYCARDTRCDHDKKVGLRALAQDVQNALPDVPVIAVFLNARSVGWEPELLTIATPEVSGQVPRSTHDVQLSIVEHLVV